MVREEILDDGPIFDLVNRKEIERWLSKKQLSDSENKFLFSFVSARMFMESV
jgi:asparagine synthase (glutamine-hydrolysing)